MSKGTLSSFLVFAVGAAVGSAATWKYFKTKYAKIAEEEIKSVYEAIAKREKKQDDSELEDIDIFPGDDQEEYLDVLKEHNYANQEVEFMAKPYVISPDEFGEYGDDYDMQSLNYWADGVVTEMGTNEVVEDVDGMIGQDSLSHFGEYEDDVVYVRNDKYKCDYEILIDTRNYADVANALPRLVEE